MRVRCIGAVADFFALRENGDEDFVVSARETVFGAKPFPRDSNRRKGRAGRTKNPREEFEAARKRGLTEGEIRSIAVEYLESGITILDTSDRTGKKLFVRRVRQQEWYLEILAEGLGLTTLQREDAEGKMREGLELDFKAFQEAVDSGIIW